MVSMPSNRQYMEKIAYKMKLRQGCVDACVARYDVLWPEMIDALRSAGIRDYSIHFDPETRLLFTTLWRSLDCEDEERSPLKIMENWWTYLSDMLEKNADGTAIFEYLVPVFHLE